MKAPSPTGPASATAVGTGRGDHCPAPASTPACGPRPGLLPARCTRRSPHRPVSAPHVGRRLPGIVLRVERLVALPDGEDQVQQLAHGVADGDGLVLGMLGDDAARTGPAPPGCSARPTGRPSTGSGAPGRCRAGS